LHGYDALSTKVLAFQCQLCSALLRLLLALCFSLQYEFHGITALGIFMVYFIIANLASGRLWGSSQII
jgi:hypothetical protein